MLAGNNLLLRMLPGEPILDLTDKNIIKKEHYLKFFLCAWIASHLLLWMSCPNTKNN
ncbi:hypothetical protein yrohd0001_27490 [Yersinia rohdei ATCC 43380]|nr:hypothetical protein yrohd0001_27490 [Yersinia rohdei ATCC 43380]